MGMPAVDDNGLDGIRREIDDIDDTILDLLARRVEASERVRDHKNNSGELAASPIRAAREAAILRRLMARRSPQVSPELLVRLWRVILTASTLTQAPIVLHSVHKSKNVLGLRLRLRDHFGLMPVEEHRDEAQALTQVNIAAGDLCVVESESPWADAFAGGKAGEARIITVLPVLREEIVPRILVFGHAKAMATGDDETIVVSDGKLPRDFAPLPLWQVKSGSKWVSCLPGFLTEHEGPLLGLKRSNTTLGLKLAGNFPSPLEVRK